VISSSPPGSEDRAPAEPTPRLARFLGFFLSGPPDRAYWLRHGRRLGKVEEPEPPEGATQVLVYRVSNGEGMAYPGEPLDRTRISVTDLGLLRGCWREPLKALNDQGEALARSRPAKRDLVCSFRQTEADRERLEAFAARSGLPVAAAAAELVAGGLDRVPGFGRNQQPA
jgi:hypothetical protein